MRTAQPGPKRLFCKPESKEQTTKSGFLLTAESQQKPQTAEVINTGSAVTEYKQRDVIYYKPYATTDIKIDGVDYFFIEEDDVLGKAVEI